MIELDPGDKERLDRVLEDYMILVEKHGTQICQMFMEALVLKTCPIDPIDMDDESKAILFGQISSHCQENQGVVFNGAMEGVHNALFPFGHSGERADIDRSMPGGVRSAQLAAVNTLMAEDAAESWGSKDPHKHIPDPLKISPLWTPQERLDLIALISAGFRYSNMNRIPPIAGNAETIMIIATSSADYLESQRRHVETAILILAQRGIVPKTGDECEEEFRQMQNRAIGL